MSSISLQLVTSLAWALPGLVVYLVGIAIGIARWRRHPAVSALIVGSLSMLVLATLASRVLIIVLGMLASNGPASMNSVAVYFSALGLTMALVRTVAWSAMVAAIFGWRTGAGEVHAAPLQFSIRGLMLLTLAVALLFGLGRAAVGWFTDSSPLLVQLLDDLPVALCQLTGMWLAISRWPRHPPVSRWALVALGISLFATTIMQVTYFILAERFYFPVLVTTYSLLWVLMATIGWALAIAAALGWRSSEPQLTMAIGQTSPQR